MSTVKDKLSLEQRELLASIVGKEIKHVFYHYNIFGEDEDKHKEDRDWIELIFTDNSKICFTSGSIAMNIEIVDFDRDIWLRRTKKVFQGTDVKFRIETTDESNSDLWNRFINKKITDCKILKHNGWLENGVVFFFNGDSVVIFAVIDYLDAKLFDIEKEIKETKGALVKIKNILPFSNFSNKGEKVELEEIK